ncbi:unnamed protein product, partial [Polarella glacialis]
MSNMDCAGNGLAFLSTAMQGSPPAPVLQLPHPQHASCPPPGQGDVRQNPQQRGLLGLTAVGFGGFAALQVRARRWRGVAQSRRHLRAVAVTGMAETATAQEVTDCSASLGTMRAESPAIQSFLQAAGPEMEAAYMAMEPLQDGAGINSSGDDAFHPASLLNVFYNANLREGDLKFVTSKFTEPVVTWLVLAVVSYKAQDGGLCLACGLGRDSDSKNAKRLASQQLLDRIKLLDNNAGFFLQLPDNGQHVAAALKAFRKSLLSKVSIMAMSPFGKTWCALIVAREGKQQVRSFAAPASGKTWTESIFVAGQNLLIGLRRELQVPVGASDDPGTWALPSQEPVSPSALPSKNGKKQKSRPSGSFQPQRGPVTMDLAGLGSPEGEDLLFELLGSEPERQMRTDLLHKARQLARTRTAGDRAMNEEALLHDLN